MIHCYQFYASPVISKPPLFRTFFDFPWDFEIAGFNCIFFLLLNRKTTQYIQSETLFSGITVISISLKRLWHWSTIHRFNQSVSSSSQILDSWSYRPSSGLRGEDIFSLRSCPLPIIPFMSLTGSYFFPSRAKEAKQKHTIYDIHTISSPLTLFIINLYYLFILFYFFFFM